ncbi:hypothetical protein ACHWQZ_G019079 [Mnemiopsis leidyi]
MLLPGEYNFTPDFTLSSTHLEDFNSLGYILLRNFLCPAEVAKALRVFEETDIIEKHGFGIPDASGRMPRMVLWNTPGDDVTGMICRCDKVVATSAQLLGGEVYHYHSKLVMKEPRIGGRQEWHQDYGYWYNNGLLTPDAISVFVPLDRCTRENGCLQVVAGSHKCGRIEHSFTGGQTGADVGRVREILGDKTGRFYHFHVEMSPGDALFFHSNVLHMSDPNDSEMVVAGSHKCGRIEHSFTGGQTGADVGRVREILGDKTGRFYHFHVEMSPGDALFFHSNVLHMSDPNDSEMVRRALIMAYNRRDNSAGRAEVAGHHPMYSPIDRVPDSAVLECDNVSDFSGKEFLLPENDRTVKSSK